MWPTQIADALRALIHQANLARHQGPTEDPQRVCDPLLQAVHDGMLVGLSDTRPTAPAPGNAKPDCCWKCCATARRRAALRPRPEGAPHLQPGRTRPTTAKIQQNISGRLTSDRSAPRTATPSAATSPPPPNTSVRGGCQGLPGLINFCWSGELLRGSAGVWACGSCRPRGVPAAGGLRSLPG